MKKVVSVAVVKEGKILLEKHVKCKGLWVMPGGKVEESDRDLICALQREAKEELGIDINHCDLTRLFRRNSTYSRIDGVITFDEHVYLVEYNERTMGEIINCEPEKHSELKWFDMNEIMSSDVLMVGEYIACNVYLAIKKAREIGTTGMLSKYIYKTRKFDLTSFSEVVDFLHYVIVEDGNTTVDVMSVCDEEAIHLIVNRGGMGRTEGINVESSADIIPIDVMPLADVIAVIRKFKTLRYHDVVAKELSKMTNDIMSLIPTHIEEETLLSLGEFDITIGYDDSQKLYAKLCIHSDIHRVYLPEDELKLFNKGATMAVRNLYTESLANRLSDDIIITKIHHDAIIPERAHDDDSGMDLFSVEEYDIAPGETKLAKTGIKIILPRNHEAQIRPKSGLALKKGLSVLNTPGTIDEGYRGEVCVILINHGKETVHIGVGEKIAQMVITKVEKPNVRFVSQNVYDEFGTERGEGGFGSTGLLSKKNK